MLDLKEKIGYLKKFKCGIVPQCGVIFLKILVKRVDHFLVESVSRMFWIRWTTHRVTEVGPHTDGDTGGAQPLLEGSAQAIIFL